MKCPFCDSEELTTSKTYAKGETLDVTKLTDKMIAGESTISVSSEVYPLSVTRRKIKCNHCGNLFFTVELFERSTNKSSAQLQANLNVLISKRNIPRNEKGLTEAQKQDIYNQIQEGL